MVNRLEEIARLGPEALEVGDLNNFRSSLPGPRGSADHLNTARNNGVADGLHRNFVPPNYQEWHSEKYLDMTPEQFYGLIEQLITKCGLDRRKVIKLHIAFDSVSLKTRLGDNQSVAEEAQNLENNQRAIELMDEFYRYVLPIAKQLLREGFNLADFS